MRWWGRRLATCPHTPRLRKWSSNTSYLWLPYDSPLLKGLLFFFSALIFKLLSTIILKLKHLQIEKFKKPQQNTFVCTQRTGWVFCIVLYPYIYIALLAVHTNQKRFQCERPREKRAVNITLLHWTPKHSKNNNTYDELLTAFLSLFLISFALCHHHWNCCCWIQSRTLRQKTRLNTGCKLNQHPI